ncbi:hypothetical protein B9T31_09470 [Acinetobacter sp. ANC 4558]|nr:hypothetical protein B9T31_09470 [Acinetobacter sp. ANC 4558]
MNGIGGRTIAEAKRRIKHSELQIWRAYREKRGSLFTARRIEQSIGGLSALYVSVKGVKDVDPYNFMPHEEKPLKVEMSLEDYMMQHYGEGN